MDEPCSALDPIATYKIEELIRELEASVHDRHRHAQHAAGVARIGHTAFMLAGEDRIGGLVEFGRTENVFTNPRDKRTEDYITGRFG